MQHLKSHKNQDLTRDSQSDIRRFIRPNFFNDSAQENYAEYSRLIPAMDSKKQFDAILMENTKENSDSSKVIFNLKDISFDDRKSNKLMLYAYKYFLKVLQDPDDALIFYRKIMGCAKFWMHTLSSSAEANIIFECQNNRGIPLTELDKVKNNLIYRVIKSKDTESNKDAVLAKINETWSSIFRTLASRNIDDRSDEEKILKDAMLILFSEDKPTLPNLTKALESLVETNKSHSIVDVIGDFVGQLKEIALAYTKIRSPKPEDGYYVLYLNELNFVVEHLNNFRPVLVALLAKKDCLKIEPNQPNPVDSVFQLARDAGFWAYCVVKRQTNYGVKELGKIASQFYSTTNYESITNRLNLFISAATGHSFRVNEQNFSQLTKPLVYVFEGKNINNDSAKKEYLAQMNLYFGPKLKEVYLLDALVDLVQKTTRRTSQQKIRGIAEGLHSQPTNFYPEKYKNSICRKKCEEYFSMCNEGKGGGAVAEVYGAYYFELVEATKEYFRYQKYFGDDDLLDDDAL